MLKNLLQIIIFFFFLLLLLFFLFLFLVSRRSFTLVADYLVILVKYIIIIIIMIIWGHFQPSRLKMSHFSAEIVPRPDKISAENVRKISDFFFGRENFGTISALKLSSSGTFSALNLSRQGHLIFSAEIVPTGTFSAQEKGHFQLKVRDIFSSKAR